MKHSSETFRAHSSALRFFKAKRRAPDTLGIRVSPYFSFPPIPLNPVVHAQGMICSRSEVIFRTCILQRIFKNPAVHNASQNFVFCDIQKSAKPPRVERPFYGV